MNLPSMALRHGLTNLCIHNLTCLTDVVHLFNYYVLLCGSWRFTIATPDIYTYGL